MSTTRPRLFSLLCALALPSLASAAGVVERADAAGNHLFIHGTGFGAFKTPLVSLAGQPLVVVSHSTTDIVAAVPAGTVGSFRVDIHSFLSAFSGENSSFDVTLGAAGPKGDQGVPGAQGVIANGQYLNRDQEPVLFAVIGTKYGEDPNYPAFTSTPYPFRMPDLTSAAPNGLTYSICTRGIFPSAN